MLNPMLSSGRNEEDAVRLYLNTSKGLLNMRSPVSILYKTHPRDQISIYLVGLGFRCVMYFGCHVTLHASSGFQVCRGIRGWDTFGGAKVTDFITEDTGLILGKVEEYVLGNLGVSSGDLGEGVHRPRVSDRDV